MGRATIPASTGETVNVDNIVATPPNVPHSGELSSECVVLSTGQERDWAAKKFRRRVLIVERGYRLYRVVINDRVPGICDIEM